MTTETNWVQEELQRGLIKAKLDVIFWTDIAKLESQKVSPITGQPYPGDNRPSKETLAEAKKAKEHLVYMEKLAKPLDWTPSWPPACGHDLYYTRKRNIWGFYEYEKCAWSKDTCPNHSAFGNPAQLRELMP